MARTLTVSRARVRPGSEREYLAAVRELARLAERRGWHLWVFRRADQPGAFMEFSESRSRETHRVVAERPEDERALEERIRAVAEYEPGAWELWEEVR
ncbi:MAG TPA: hypothetical protein VHG35_10535 [Gemmatimonadales bacterium]|nr:hypothetical protein [Gemmatimonadales bacterium]